jgi:hypothetical protein
MVYGAEVVLLADITFRSPHVENFDEDRSNEARELEVNCSEEQWLDSCVHTSKYLAVLRRYYNRNVKECLFIVGDLVLKWKKTKKACTSSHLLGKDRFRSSKSPDLLHIGWLTSMVLKYPTPGILTNLGVSTYRAHK